MVRREEGVPCSSFETLAYGSKMQQQRCTDDARCDEMHECTQSSHARESEMPLSIWRLRVDDRECDEDESVACNQSHRMKHN